MERPACRTMQARRQAGAGTEDAGTEDAGTEDADAASGTEAPDAVPANELTGSYDHLWDKTVMRRIEDAAVRDEPEEELADQPGVEPDGPEESADGHGDQQEAAAQEPSQGGAQPPFHAQPPVPAQPAAPAVPAQPAAPLIPAQQGGLIDSVPWNTGGDMPVRPAGPPSFVPESFVPPSSARHAGLAKPLSGARAGRRPRRRNDHEKRPRRLGTAPQAPAPAAGSGPATGPMVLARVCAQGHANPPTHSQCTGCGLALASDAVQVRRPRLGRVRVSTGELIDLDQSLVIGRQPSVSRVQGGGMPRLVQVASPSGDISRSHVEVRLEGWHVMLCDLKATNGTVLVREGQPPRRLAQNEMAILLDGDIAELGDDVSLRFEEIL